MKFIYNNAGRNEAGYKGEARDCVVRAIAIAAEKPYQEVYDAINKHAEYERGHKRSSARNGVFRKTYEKYLLSLGFKWTPTMKIGQGCKVHLREEELPEGRLVVAVSRHLCAVINGVIHDIYDPSRAGNRCVYGYYKKG